MKSVYTEKDLLVIRSEYEALMELAARRCRNEEQIAWVRKAYELASTAHKGVRLHSGRPYMIYPLQVARIVVEKIGLGYHSICASLLLGILDNTSYTVEDIRNLFDDKTARLSEGLRNISKVLERSETVGASSRWRRFSTTASISRVSRKKGAGVSCPKPWRYSSLLPTGSDSTPSSPRWKTSG